MNHNQSFSKQEVFDSPLVTQSLEIKCKKVQDYKDGTGLQFIKFDCATSGPEIKIAILMKIWIFSRYFVSLVYILLFSFYFVFIF